MNRSSNSKKQVSSLGDVTQVMSAILSIYDVIVSACLGLLLTIIMPD